MNARIVLPLAILTSIASLSVGLAPPASAAGAAIPDTDAQARARAALYAGESPDAAPAQFISQPAPAETTAAPVQEMAAPSHGGPEPDTEAQAKARAAVRSVGPAPAAIEFTTSTVQIEPVAAGVVQQTAKPRESSATVAPFAAGMEAPALPTSQSQQQQLDALLEQYRADQISALDYHTRRAEILAGR